MLDRLWLAWWSAPWLLLLLPLLVRWLPLREEPRAEALRLRIELPVAVILGVGLALGFSLFMIHPLPDTFPLSASDFDHYCEMTARVADGTVASFAGPRFPAPAWLPGFASRWLGIVDALAVQSFLALVVTLAALYLWGLAVDGRTAGVAAALLAAAVVPLVFLVRDLTFYPVLVAGVASMGASLALLVRTRSLGPCLALGTACGLTLLTDVRAPVYVVPVLVLGVLLAPWRVRGSWQRAVGLALVLLPVALSWLVAHRVVPADTTALEHQVGMYLEEAVRGVGAGDSWRREVLDGVLHQPGFLWGHSSPLDLPGTLLRLQQLGAGLPAHLAQAPGAQVLRSHYVTPWGLPAVLAVLVVVGASWRQPWRLVALVGGAGPCLLVLYNVSSAMPQERHLATALLPVPLLFGVFVALASRRGLPEGRGSVIAAWAWRPGLVWALLLLALLGAPGSWLSPAVRWRRGVVQTEPRATLLSVLDGKPLRDDHCTWQLTREAAQPGWPSRLYPAARVILDQHRGESGRP